MLDQVPIKIRNTGVYPQIDILQPGDLLLVSPMKPPMTAKLITWAQRRLHSEENAQWMHAAIYLGDNSLVEIDGGGVKVAPLFKYVLTHRMLFRRLLKADGSDIDQITGFRIAISALKQFKRSYAHANIAVTAWDCASIGWREAPARAVRNKGSICSDFFNEVAYATTNRAAAPVHRLPLQPADLSASRMMRDLPMVWSVLV